MNVNFTLEEDHDAGHHDEHLHPDCPKCEIERERIERARQRIARMYRR